MKFNEPSVIFDELDSVLIIKFNRPEIRSPLTFSIVQELTLRVEETSIKPSIKKIIFTGRDKVFAAGADLNEVLAVKTETARNFAETGQRLMKAIQNSKKKTIAAVNGFCYGGAFDLAMSCDIRLASPSAIFCHPGVNIGIMTGWGGTQKLPRLVGEATALEMLFTAAPVNADKALSIGLIDEISSDPFKLALQY